MDCATDITNDLRGMVMFLPTSQFIAGNGRSAELAAVIAGAMLAACAAFIIDDCQAVDGGLTTDFFTPNRTTSCVHRDGM